ncbi:tryptophan-rich sensory protein [Pseudonocardia sp. HH130630-07]|uniref:tryptophan-rich sensory protein n=1 Tax=Pseudonocardia sp. HH130630-07 TaxID=1690815 RepID=UPI000815156C|nr:tryptophan-rich sensory protein [Pseudonocardia sp. HH130630-07]ANY09753.1 hypothetical protein AFB00_03170 [Pseudonocardia sp. HH130630-07]
MTVLTPRPTTTDLVRGAVVAALAIVQVLVSAFGGAGIGEVARSYDTPLLAAGWAFSIWGLIYLGFAVYAVYALLPAQRGRPIHRRTGWWLAASAVLNPLWILAFSARWVVAAELVLVALVAVLAVAYSRLSREEARDLPERLAFRLPVSLYLGWSSVALVLGLMAAGSSVGLPAEGVLPQTAAVLLLVILTAVVLSVIGSTSGFAGFAAGVVWALAGVAANDRPIAVTVVAVVAAVLVAVQAVRRVRRSVQPARLALG